jgi:hypothetical protein
VNGPRDRESAERRADFGQRLFAAALAGFDLFGIYLGDRLGFYRVLAGRPGLTALELAEATRTDARYAREWLEQQAASGIVEVVGSTADPEARQFRLPVEHAAVLADRDALDFLSPLVRQLVAAGRSLDLVLEAFRNGGGVPWEAYGPDMVEGVSDGNRAMFLNLLATDWFPAIPELDRRLSDDPPARVADIGCGSGWSSIAIARAYPRVQVDGFDSHQGSIDLARRNAGAAGLSDRVTFVHRDAADPVIEGAYDLVTAFECIHDMSRPVEALSAARSLVVSDGFVLVVDEAVADEFAAPATDVDRFIYGFSITTCLPAARVERCRPRPSAR